MDSDDSGLWEPTKPRQGISLVATHQHQIKQGDPTQAIYVNNLVKYRTPMDSDDFQTLPLSSAVKFSCETQRLRWPWLFCLSHQVERLTRCCFGHWDYNLRVKHDQYDIWWFGESVKGIHNFKKKACNNFDCPCTYLDKSMSRLW